MTPEIIKLGAGGFPIIKSDKHMDGLTLACPKCWSTNVTLTVRSVGVGSGPGGSSRIGDASLKDVTVCNACKHYGMVK